MIKGKRKFREAFEIDEDNVSNYFQQHFEEILDPAIAATLLASINVENEPKRIVLVSLCQQFIF